MFYCFAYSSTVRVIFVSSVGVILLSRFTSEFSPTILFYSATFINLLFAFLLTYSAKNNEIYVMTLFLSRKGNIT